MSDPTILLVSPIGIQGVPGTLSPEGIAASEAAVNAADEAQASATQAALYDGPKVDTFAELAAVAPAQLAVGELIRVIDRGTVYQRVSTGGDLDYTGTGGVRLSVVPQQGRRVASAYSAPPSDDKTYLYGPDFVTSGTALYNFPADDYQRVIGQEYLAAFHARVVGGNAYKARLWGDSRVAGQGQSGNFIMFNALREAARRRGYLRGTWENNGIGGSTIQNWIDTHIDTYLTGTGDPQLVIFMAGINDLYIPFGPATPAQVVARMDAALAKIRVTKGYALAALSVAVLVPLSAYNPSEGRDPRYIEQVRDGFRRLSRKHQVCFIDAYSVAADGRNQRGLGYAADITAPEVIHQNNTGMIPILDLLINSILPDLTPMVGGGVSIESGTAVTVTAAALPSTYPGGISMNRATPGGGGSNWPVDGFVQTTNFVDDIQVQFNWAVASSDTAIWMRKGRSNVWGNWVSLLPSTVTATNATPASGFVLPGAFNMRTSRQGNVVNTDGYVNVSPAATIAAGTTIATIATGNRPVTALWGVSLSVWDGTNWQHPRARIMDTGEIITMDAVAITATRVYLNGVSWAVA